MGLRLSGSKIGLAMGCRHPFRADVDVPWQPGGEAAERGTAFHLWAEHLLRSGAPDVGGVVPPSGPYVDEQAERARAWHEQWRGLGYAVLDIEAPYAYDPITERCRRLRGYGREAYRGVEPHEVTCTVDAVCTVDAGQTLVIVDHKTGRQTAPASEHPQIQACAAIAAAAIDWKGDVRGELHYVRDDGSIHIDSARIEPLGMAATLYELRRLHDTIPGADPTPGPHCTDAYCPLVTSCPAVRREVERVIPPDQLLARIESPTDLQRWLEMKPKAHAILKELDSAAKAYCDENGGQVRLPSGQTYRQVEATHTKLDSARVRADHGDRYDYTTSVISYRRVGKKRS